MSDTRWHPIETLPTLVSKELHDAIKAWAVDNPCTCDACERLYAALQKEAEGQEGLTDESS